MNENVYALAKKLGDLCLEKKITLAVAESCTGGMLSACLTEVPGSSKWFQGGVVAYSNFLKENLLNVSAAVLKNHGAVSEETAKAMVKGVLEKTRATVALSITGVAGPGGGSKEKPVGTVCFAIATEAGLLESHTQHFLSGREAIRHHSVVFAIMDLIRIIQLH
ncbi:MAG: hypothetical protein A3E82_00945 [Gammaproteobacteria bacterium RIFCSPHIGHO2_12_FULL_38_11]|nr:MAG: hypothetical protein A3E82_00945 [Gammaproteobacteria bacterium RIFCSPHIGHO2_12_FULL_38_11]